MTLTVDPDVIGGVPMGGLDFGAAVNAQAIIDHASMFDFIDGGGLDVAVLGMAQCDASGNINVSRFSGRRVGCGGFVDISQRSKKVVFVGAFAAGGLMVSVEEGRLAIVREGRHPKFIAVIDEITFSGRVAAAEEREILYVTERCVFRLGERGLELAEVAPGIDIERDILARLPFPLVVGEVRPMEPAIFRPAPMGLRTQLLDIRIEDRISYNADTNTVFLNYAGMHVRTEEDLGRIKDAVDRTLEPLGRRVHSIVNYDSFVADPDILDKYADLVKYVEERYYISVSRYATSGFLRLKLGAELRKRRLSSHVFETRREARRHLGAT
ncbi:MAG TPA: hypothetical protein VEL48_11165 [Candidatus Acidoferrales bacterium]|nr:hypothetical protein [Candidatus Acidoferrales bacterium]